MRAFDHARAEAYLDRAHRFGIHPSLDGIRELVRGLGDPQTAFASIQVAGTNGKTSTVRLAAAILDAHGELTGVYTSPYLSRRTDQFVIGGTEIDSDAFSRAVSAVAEVAEARSEPSTEFELTTATALEAFREAGVRWAVLEVGMGGRWDATSVVTPAVSVVTGVDIDHAAHLGDTREAIAAEKAQIISPGGRAVLGPGVGGVLEVFLARIQETEVPHVLVTEAPVPGDVVFEVTGRPEAPDGATRLAVSTTRAFYPDLLLRAPAYQAPNAALAIATVEAALGRRADEEETREALADACFPGRFEVLDRDPWVVADGAHNPAAAAVLARAVKDAFAEPPVFVLGVLNDKDAAGIVQALIPAAAGFVVTASGSERARSPETLAALIETTTGDRPDVTSTVSEALETAMRRSRSGVVVTGSLTVAAAARAALT